MGTQVIDFNNVETVVFNGQEVDTLMFNNTEVWSGFKKLGQLIDRSIESVTAEDLEGVTTIGERAFYLCLRLEKVTLPEGVTTIKSNAFYGCSALKEITFPSTVTNIGSASLFACQSITIMKLLPTTPPTLASQAISDTPTRIEVPANSLSAYQSASGWADHASAMVGV